MRRPRARTGGSSAARGALEERRAEVRAGWGEKYVERVHEKGKLTTRERIERLKDAGTRSLRGRHLRQLRRRLRQARIPGGRRRHRLRPRRRPLERGHRQRQHGRLGLVVAADAGEDRARPGDGAAAAAAGASTSSTAPGSSCPSSRAPSPARRAPAHIFKMNSLLSADGVPQIAGVFGDCIAGGGYMPIISRPRLHDRAGLHGHRRRGADQGRQEPADHLARHRRPRRPRAPSRLRRRARARRRQR